jgi:hypothetical protein
MKLPTEYVILGVAVLFVGMLLYGTWRRNEEFTNIRGNYPPWSVIQQQVRAFFDKYYEYDLSEFAKISETDIFPAVKERIEKMPDMNYKFILANPEMYSREPLYKQFLPKGFVADMANAPVTTCMGVYESVRKWAASSIKTYDPKKPPKQPIDGMIKFHYIIELASVVFKNEVIIEFIDEAMKRVKPKLKTA